MDGEKEEEGKEAKEEEKDPEGGLGKGGEDIEAG